MDRGRGRGYLRSSTAKDEREWGVMASISSRLQSDIRVIRSDSLGRLMDGMSTVDSEIVNHRWNVSVLEMFNESTNQRVRNEGAENAEACRSTMSAASTVPECQTP